MAEGKGDDMFALYRCQTEAWHQFAPNIILHSQVGVLEATLSFVKNAPAHKRWEEYVLDNKMTERQKEDQNHREAKVLIWFIDSYVCFLSGICFFQCEWIQSTLTLGSWLQ